MNFKVIKQLYKKEILDVLRDKKDDHYDGDRATFDLSADVCWRYGHDVKSDNTDGYTDI